MVVSSSLVLAGAAAASVDGIVVARVVVVVVADKNGVEQHRSFRGALVLVFLCLPRFST